MLPFKTRRTSQPQGAGATIDRSSALGSLDWRLLFSGGGSVSGSANPNWPTPVGTGSVIGVGQAGRSIGTNREKQGDYWSWGDNPKLKLDSMCGFCVFDRSAASTVASSLFDTGITSSNNLGLGININSDGSLALNYQDHANLVTTTSTPYKPGINVVAWRWDNVAGTGAIIYNGQKFTGATSPKTFTHGVASSCGYYSSPSGYGNTACGIYMLGISSNGNIDDSTLSRIHNEYLSLFKPVSRSLWIPGTVSVGGAVNYTLSAAVGGYSVSGNAATLSYAPGTDHYTLTASGGVYALSGKPATLTYTSLSPVNYTLSAAKGAYSVIGMDASFAFSGAQKGGGIPRKKFQIETAQGVIAVDSLAEASRIIARAKKSASKPVVTLQGIKVAAPTKKTLDYKAIEARMRADIQAEIDDEEDLLMML